MHATVQVQKQLFSSIFKTQHDSKIYTAIKKLEEFISYEICDVGILIWDPLSDLLFFLN